MIPALRAARAQDLPSWSKTQSAHRKRCRFLQPSDAESPASQRLRAMPHQVLGLRSLIHRCQGLDTVQDGRHGRTFCEPFAPNLR